MRIALTLVVLLAGCGASTSATPESAMLAFARALRAGDADAAWALTSDGYRSRVSRADFDRWVREDTQELRALAEQLERPAGPAVQEATAVVGDAETVHLVRDPDGWRVASDLVDYYGQGTPTQTLRTFVRAVERGRWDVVLRLVPEADREGMTEEGLREQGEGSAREEMQRLAAGLRAALDAGTAIEESGDRATMPWGEQHRAQLARIDGRWMIEDPD